MATAAFVITVAGIQPAAAQTPIRPDNRPAPVSGQRNGEFPTSILINVAPHCQAVRAAGPSLGLLLNSANRSGIPLDTRECYRPVSGQVAAQQQWTTQGNSACAARPATSSSGKPVGTSMHGWGKAVDFGYAATGLSFDSVPYRWLKANAGQLGWNHPAFAEPGGSACPEAWHWEWVGDGGAQHLDTIRADAVSLVPAPNDAGYSIVTGLGAVSHHGTAPDAGDVASTPLNWLIAAATATPSGNGYWLVGVDGGVFSFGDARFFGSTGSIKLNQPIVAMASTPSGNGYWLVAADGGVFTFGDAQFFGSTGSTKLRSPIVAVAATPTGKGYWLAASDGGIFAFGDARFFGSTGSTKLNRPIFGFTATQSGNGYWIVASDGGIFGFGDAAFHGSTGSTQLAEPIVGMAATRTGKGYWMVAADGGVFSFGDARFFGAG